MMRNHLNSRFIFLEAMLNLFLGYPSVKGIPVLFLDHEMKLKRETPDRMLESSSFRICWNGQWGLQLISWNYGHNKMSITRRISKIFKKFLRIRPDGWELFTLIFKSPCYWIYPVKSNTHRKLSIISRNQLYSRFINKIYHCSTTLNGISIFLL